MNSKKQKYSSGAAVCEQSSKKIKHVATICDLDAIQLADIEQPPKRVKQQDRQQLLDKGIVDKEQIVEKSGRSQEPILMKKAVSKPKSTGTIKVLDFCWVWLY